jgi:hypothetical protein
MTFIIPVGIISNDGGWLWRMNLTLNTQSRFGKNNLKTVGIARDEYFSLLEKLR